MGGPIFMIYVSYDVSLRKELPFGGHTDYICIKIFFSGVNFFIHDEFLNALTI